MSYLVFSVDPDYVKPRLAGGGVLEFPLPHSLMLRPGDKASVDFHCSVTMPPDYLGQFVVKQTEGVHLRCYSDVLIGEHKNN